MFKRSFSLLNAAAVPYQSAGNLYLHPMCNGIRRRHVPGALKNIRASFVVRIFFVHRVWYLRDGANLRITHDQPQSAL